VSRVTTRVVNGNWRELKSLRSGFESQRVAGTGSDKF